MQKKRHQLLCESIASTSISPSSTFWMSRMLQERPKGVRRQAAEAITVTIMIAVRTGTDMHLRRENTMANAATNTAVITCRPQAMDQAEHLRLLLAREKKTPHGSTCTAVANYQSKEANECNAEVVHCKTPYCHRASHQHLHALCHTVGASAKRLTQREQHA